MGGKQSKDKTNSELDQTNTSKREKNQLGSKWNDVEKVGDYCEGIIFLRFFGQTSSFEQNDKCETTDVLHLGLYLSLLDKYLRKQPPSKFNPEDEEFVHLLKLVAVKRRYENESVDDCFKRLLKDAKRFQRFYVNRAEKHPELTYSQPLNHEKYWGTRQQMLAGKVTCDWLEVFDKDDDDDDPMDPIYGVLLNPTAGRAGPGDSGWFHKLVYDEFGVFAYHSAVHDAFGYLITYHDVGPGYDYMDKSLLKTNSPYAGQFDGLSFWKDKINEVEQKLKIIDNFKNV